MTSQANRQRISLSRATPSGKGGGGKGRSSDEAAEEAVSFGRRRNGGGRSDPLGVGGARRLA